MTRRPRRVLVTGGGSGIGAAISAAFVSSGARIVIGHSDQESADRALSRLAADGLPTDRMEAVGADLATAAGCSRLIERAVSILGAVDVLVNNAAVVGPVTRVTIDETPDDLLDRIIDTNLKAPFRLVRNVSAHLTAGSVIVNIGSVTGLSALERAAAYCISKSGIEMLTKAAALELGSRQIRVVGVAPGDIDGRQEVCGSGRHGPPDLVIDPSHSSVLQRPGQPAEVAAAVLFLASREASYISGSTIIVDGGLLAGL